MASPKNLTKDDVVKAGLDVINAGEKISTAASEFPSAELGENLEDLADNRKSFRNLFKGKTSVNAGTYGSSSIIGKASTSSASEKNAATDSALLYIGEFKNKAAAFWDCSSRSAALMAKRARRIFVRASLLAAFTSNVSIKSCRFRS